MIYNPGKTTKIVIFIKLNVEIKNIHPDKPEVIRLFKLLDSHNLSHCPPEICHLATPEKFINENSILLGVFCDGILCGMGGLIIFTDYAEITRMFVLDEYRGNKFSLKILNHLEQIAIERKVKVLKLETSEKFEKAFSIYLKYGFILCRPFGEYVAKPYNTYMEKYV